MPHTVKLIRLLGASVVAQIILSCANFFVSLLLFRHASDAEFGMFVLVRSAVTLLISAQDSWLSAPLAVAVPGKSELLKRQMIGTNDVRQRRFLRWAVAVALPIPALGYHFGFWSLLGAAISTFGVLWGWLALHREFLRGLLLIYARPHAILLTDLGYVLVLLTGLILAALGPDPAVIGIIVALSIASWVGSIAARRSLARDPGWLGEGATGYERELRPLAIWGTVGATIYWMHSLGYNYVLAGRIDLAAVRDVNAAYVLLMPTVVLNLGVKTLLLPTAAGWLAESSLGQVVRRLLIFAMGIAALDLIYIGFAWSFRDWLTTTIVYREIGDRDRLLIFWAMILVTSQIREVLQIALLALRRFQLLTWLTGVSAVTSLSIAWIAIDRWGVLGVLIGQLAGEAVNTLGVIVVMTLAARKASHA